MTSNQINLLELKKHLDKVLKDKKATISLHVQNALRPYEGPNKVVLLFQRDPKTEGSIKYYCGFDILYECLKMNGHLELNDYVVLSKYLDNQFNAVSGEKIHPEILSPFGSPI